MVPTSFQKSINMYETNRKIAEKSGNAILFQLPYVTIDTPAAVNIWTKNIAQAFSLSGYQVTIQYLCDQSFSSGKENGVELIGLTSPQAWILAVPKLRALMLPILQNYSYHRIGRNYTLTCALGGPFIAVVEKRKIAAAHKAGLKYLHSIMEHPSVIQKRNVSEYLFDVANEYDYLMPISTHLRDLYKEHGRTKPIMLNPIIVNTNTIRVSGLNATDKIENLLYCGDLSHDEEMYILLKAFSLSSNAISSLKLTVLGGTSSQKETNRLLNRYQTVCSELGISDTVNFLGKLPHKEVISHYHEAHAFLLPRPFRPYSQAGFPSKLGEYLATGKPVITTGTGDIPMYLEDGISAYVVMDDSPEAFANRTVEAVGHSKAYDIGQKGAKIAKKSFSIEATARRIESFFKSLNEE